MKKLVALVAALVLTVPLAGCGIRDRRDSRDGTSQQQQTPAATADPASAEDALDDLDDMIGGLEHALDDADAFAASADAD